jgi:hypothetical protein
VKLNPEEDATLAARSAPILERLRAALEWMTSADSDWEDGEVGVGHGFRVRAHEAVEHLRALDVLLRGKDFPELLRRLVVCPECSREAGPGVSVSYEPPGCLTHGGADVALHCLLRADWSTPWECSNALHKPVPVTGTPSEGWFCGLCWSDWQDPELGIASITMEARLKAYARRALAKHTTLAVEAERARAAQHTAGRALIAACEVDLDTRRCRPETLLALNLARQAFPEIRPAERDVYDPDAALRVASASW